MQQKKGAIELSLNFIVIIVISIAVLILSFAFVRKIYTGATNTQETYYKQFEDQMEALACDSLDRVCIGKNTKTIDSSGVAVFTMRILNIGVVHTPGSNNFNIYESKIENSCKDMPNLNSCSTKFDVSLAQNYEIPENEAQSLIIAIAKKNAQSGTYIFDVLVEQYPEEKQKLYVVVP